MIEKVLGGAFLISRKLFVSDIWQSKPSGWLKIWIYVLGKVNHSDSERFKRGQGYFNFSREIKDIGNDITPDTIKSFFQYGRRVGMLATERTTRGIVVTVLKYNDFQNLSNYITTTETTREPQENHERTTPIHKNVNNVKNEKNNTDSSFSSFLEALLKSPAYEGIDVTRELAKIDNWILAHPNRKKTKRFIVNWLNKIDPGIKVTPTRTGPPLQGSDV